MRGKEGVSERRQIKRGERMSCGEEGGGVLGFAVLSVVSRSFLACLRQTCVTMNSTRDVR